MVIASSTVKTLTRADLSERVQADVGLPYTESSLLVDAFLEEVMHNLAVNNQMKLTGFGSFLVRPKKQRLGRNPKTGVDAVIAARRVVSFRPALTLKQRILAIVGTKKALPTKTQPLKAKG
jgi:integration host factor subunit alpha